MKYVAVALVALCACSSSSDYDLDDPSPSPGDSASVPPSAPPPSGAAEAAKPAPPAGEPTDPASYRGVYITSRKSLYRYDVEAKTVRRAADYDCVGFGHGAYTDGGGMMDVAVDPLGKIHGVVARGPEVLLVEIDVATGHCVTQQSLGHFDLKALAFVPGATNSADELVSSFGTNYVGIRIGLYGLSMLGTSMALRQMGFIEDIASSPGSDVFAIDHSITTSAKPRLVRVDPKTGAAESVVGFVDAPRVTGLAYWKRTLYGVTPDRRVISIDPSTAAKVDLALDIEAGDDDFSGAAATIMPE